MILQKKVSALMEKKEKKKTGTTYRKVVPSYS